MTCSSRCVSKRPWPPEGTHEASRPFADHVRREARHPVAGDPEAAPARESRLDRDRWRSGGTPGQASGRRAAAPGAAGHARLPARARWDEGDPPRGRAAGPRCSLGPRGRAGAGCSTSCSPSHADSQGGSSPSGRCGRPPLVLEPGWGLGPVVQRGVRGPEAAIAAGLASSHRGAGIHTADLARRHAPGRASLAPLGRRGRAIAHPAAVLTAGMGLGGCA